MSLQHLCIRRKKGFTLVELLVVIAIIGILIGMLLPAVQQVREAARRTECGNRIRQLGLACHNFESSRMRLPAGGTNNAAPFGTGAVSPGGHSWMAAVTPFLELSAISDQCRFNEQEYDAQEIIDTLAQTLVPTFKCPSSPLEEFTANRNLPGMIADYVAISGHIGGFGGLEGPESSSEVQDGQFRDTFGIIAQNGVFFNNSEIGFEDIFDGTSNTLIISEISDFIFIGPGEGRGYRPGGRGEQTNENSVGWHAGWQTNTSPDYLLNCTTLRYLNNPGESLLFSPEPNDGVHFRGYNAPLRSAHPGGVQALMGDASIRFLQDSVSLTILAQLANRNDGLPVGDF